MYLQKLLSALNLIQSYHRCTCNSGTQMHCLSSNSEPKCTGSGSAV